MRPWNLVVPAASNRVTTANMLTNLGVSAKLFHAADGTAFADLMIDGHRETWPVRSLRLRSWLRRKYYEATGAAPGAGAISSPLNLLEARPRFSAPRRAPYLPPPAPHPPSPSPPAPLLAPTLHIAPPR